jgi:hypothetical protein
MIKSTRLRSVDTPDAETPGAAKAPAPSAAATDAAVAPTHATPKGLVIGLIAGGAVLLVVAIVAVIALVLYGFSGRSAVTASTVVDINAAPVETWNYDFVGSADKTYIGTEPSVVAVGSDKALVWSSFDYSSFLADQGNSEGWYSGYDADYSDGYAAGEQYSTDYQIWYDDPTTTSDTMPDSSDYFTSDALGFSDGFSDAQDGNGEGYSQKVKPAEPDYTPSLALVNVTNGDVIWNVDLSDAIDGVDYTSSIEAYDIDGSNAIVVQASIADGDTTTYVIAALSTSTGEVISSANYDVYSSVAAVGGDVIVATTAVDGSDATVGRYSVDALDDNPKWEADTDAVNFITVENNYIFVTMQDSGEVLHASDGKEADFGDDLDTASYYFIGNQLVREESTDRGYQIEGYGLDGDPTWKDTVDADMTWLSNGVILTADANSDGGFSGLMRIDPSNGSEQWDDTYDQDFDGVAGVVGNSVILISGKDAHILDLGNGQEKLRQRVGELNNFFLGDGQYYVVSGQKLTAYSYGDKGSVWKFTIDDTESVTQIGRQLAVVNSDKGKLYGLAAK